MSRSRTSETSRRSLSAQPPADPPGEARERDDGRPETPAPSDRPAEIGGRPGPDPTRYGDWEKNGRCIDF